MSEANEGFGVAKPRAGAGSEHGGAEKDEVRYPSLSATQNVRPCDGFFV